ncbi:MAG: chloride channel protein [Acidimicrobiales bacterium]
MRTFHDRSGRLAVRQAPWKLLAAVATLGLGGPVGYEGPSIYAGAAVGTSLQRRLRRFFTAADAKVLLVAGAAAGVAAIFKAPVTGLVFALEVPYQEDLARKMLLPAAISAAASYVTFAAIAGTEPLLPVAGQPPFDLRDLGGAAAVGLIAGLLARAFVALVQAAKALSSRGNPVVRATIGGLVMAAVVLAGHLITEEPLVIGPGYDALRWALDPQRSVVAIIALGTLRVVGTTAVLGGGGVGGLFIPLVIQGALVGRALGGVFDTANTTLFPVVGMAAFLGAGYRVPLAAVVFVAEVTGRPGFVVPGLIAAVVAQLVVGRASVSAYQIAGRVGHLEGRLRLPLSSVVDTETRTVPPDATVEELFWQHLVAGRQHSTAVVDGDTYLGIVGTDQANTIDRSAWPTTRVAAIMRTDVAAAEPAWPLRDAIEAMDAAATDRLAVCDAGGFVGVITATDLVQLDEILGDDEP